MKIVIVEDEPAAASQLKFLLNQLKIEHEILATIESVADGISWFSEHENPDLIFSDIQLADGISFEIYEQIELKSAIIFTTAFDEFAIRAFKLNSIDYLLKPIDLASLRFAIEKFNNQQLMKEELLNSLIKQRAFSVKNYRKSFLVKFRDKLLPIKSEDFAFFYIENSLVYGQVFDGRKFILDFKLDDIETQLDPVDFTRANRQYIVSRNSISELVSYINSRLQVKTNPKAPSDIIVSKEKVTLFKKWFENIV
ncbi:LytTR family two component transcriptional regulator [Arcicella aurantiaca]|uniref:LytTR family two component transcriptional regulator n=1 Tax=Arcicella aurantiaca TaxID=591202 RepID=A0A316EDX3_9BACT|nr:LytTR family DNA-binding domain-containing protein [Arcicella aurantiaca]PWK27580.1 LytTR family two component transcriptional regulator [Arcicella aurantiaca]